jgi:exodeoxyribonuclease VII large subunit
MRPGEGEEGGGAASALSVSELTSAVKDRLESGFSGVWVHGEISNLRLQPSGHAYFTLKDDGAQLSVVMFRGDLSRSKFQPKDGMQVVMYGSVTVYEARGQYQLVARQASEAGAGKMQAEFERLRKRLAEEGLFDPARKRKLPAVPRRIGFITSPTGAAIQDFCRILIRREWTGRVVVLPARVQGAVAAEEMLAMLGLAQRLTIDLAGEPEVDGPGEPFFDLLVIGRGGGSLEDMWCFNDEALVRAVSACRIPIISAVGHEIDFCLCDFAADARAETPSGAAELVSSGLVTLRDAARRLRERLDLAVERSREDAAGALRVLAERLARQSPTRRFEQMSQRLDDIAQRLNLAGESALIRARGRLAALSGRFAGRPPEVRLAALRSRLDGVVRRLAASSPEARVALLREKVKGLGGRLESLGPASVLKRGFALVRDADGRPVSSAAAASLKSDLILEYSDGRVPVHVVR